MGYHTNAVRYRRGAFDTSHRFRRPEVACCREPKPAGLFCVPNIDLRRDGFSLSVQREGWRAASFRCLPTKKPGAAYLASFFTQRRQPDLPAGAGKEQVWRMCFS